MTNLPFSSRFPLAKSWLKRLVYALIALGLLLLAAAGLMAFFSAPPSAPHPLLQGYNTKPPKYNQDDLNAAIGHLSQLLSVPTSPSQKESSQLSLKPFTVIQRHLQNNYPAFHALARRRIMADGSILYFWPGTNRQIEPALWLAHMDVKPASNAKEWLFPPFSGAVTDAGIWGRGSLANKTNLVAMLEALDSLARTGFKPQRGLYLAFSHDAESLNKGNKAISQLLKKEGTHFSYILDEGGYVTERFLAQIKQPIAFVGIAEKGRIDIEINQHDHLTPALDQLKGQHFKTDDTVLQLFLNSLAPYLSFKQRLAINNHWLLSGLVHRQAKANSYLHNMFTSSILVDEQVNTQNGLIKISVSTLPKFKTEETEDSDKKERETLINRIEDAIEKEVKMQFDGGVKMIVSENSYKASDITPIEGKPYQLLWQSINQTYKNSFTPDKQTKSPSKHKNSKDIIVAPILQLERSSSSFYQDLSQHILRFSYLPLSPETQSSLSGLDEHITKHDLRNAITFYYFLAKNTLIAY